MRHKIAFRKLNRTSEHRLAMFRTMVTQLIQHERIQTTLPKAKELRRVADKMVTLAKKGKMHHQRKVAGFVRDPLMVHKLCTTLADRYANRAGGYTRILRTGHRYGDAADMAFIEFVDREGELRAPRHQVYTEKTPVMARMEEILAEMDAEDEDAAKREREQERADALEHIRETNPAAYEELKTKAPNLFQGKKED
jgi:large subunit ribosomal protein L17